MEINQRVPIFGVDADDVPASEYRVTMPGSCEFAWEMLRRKIAPEAIITQDTGEKIKCWLYNGHIVAYRGGIDGGAGWEVCAVYNNCVRPHMIPADLDLVLDEKLAGANLRR